MSTAIAILFLLLIGVALTLLALLVYECWRLTRQVKKYLESFEEDES